MRMIDPLIQEIEQEAAGTKRTLERVPGGKLAWRPHPKSLALGQLALHLATAPGVVAQFTTMDSLERPDSFAYPAPKSVEEVLTAHTESVASAKRILGDLDDVSARKPWKLTKGSKVLMEIPKIALVRVILLNHTIHHRAQLGVYLRLLDIPVPSIYGPSADENPFGM